LDFRLWIADLTFPQVIQNQKSKIQNAWLCACLLTAGCAVPEYAVRQTPVPDESAAALHIERAISAVQAKEFEQQGARPIGRAEVLQGIALQSLIDRLSRMTERSSLPYRAFLYHDRDPNAAALADGRIYISTGMLTYLAGHVGRTDELAFVIGHELAHTVAQHLVKRYRMLQQQQLLMALLATGASAATRGAGTGVQQAGQLALDVAGMLQNVANSGYSQDQELEADQLGIRYVIWAGYNPRAALDLLQDFMRLETPGVFLRTHPYAAQRRVDLERYLAESSSGLAPPSADSATSDPDATQRINALRQAQRLYPVGSVSWTNLQRQIDQLKRQQ